MVEGLRKRGAAAKADTHTKAAALNITPPAPETTESKYRKVLTRTITGFWIIVFFTGIILSDHAISGLFTISLQVLVFKEITALRYVAAKEKNLKYFRLLNWFFLLATLFYYYGKQAIKILPLAQFSILSRSHLAISFGLYCTGFILFILTLQPGLYKYQFGHLTWTLMTLLLFVVQANFMISNIYTGLIWFLLPCAVIVCNDIMAYFCGFFLGHKFFERPLMTLSPNKTWEGFIGATFWTLLFAFFFSSFLSSYEWMVCPKADTAPFMPLHCPRDPIFDLQAYYLPADVSAVTVPLLGPSWDHVTVRPIQLHALVVALFGSLIAPFGGFYASGIKRAYKVKDFNNLFPGHGGVTDRTDCQYIMGFFMYVYLHTFVLPESYEADDLLRALLLLSLPEQQIVYQKLGDAIAAAKLNITASI